MTGTVHSSNSVPSQGITQSSPGIIDQLVVLFRCFRQTRYEIKGRSAFTHMSGVNKGHSELGPWPNAPPALLDPSVRLLRAARRSQQEQHVTVGGIVHQTVLVFHWSRPSNRKGNRRLTEFPRREREWEWVSGGAERTVLGPWNARFRKWSYSLNLSIDVELNAMKMVQILEDTCCCTLSVSVMRCSNWSGCTQFIAYKVTITRETQSHSATVAFVHWRLGVSLEWTIL